MTRECTLVCPIRRSTYESLSQQGLLARATVIALDNHLDQLDDYRAWKLSRPLTAGEHNWILELLADDEGQSQLNSFLVDKVCVPAIRYGRWQRFNRQDRQTTETIYQGLVYNQEPRLRQLTAAVHWVGEITVKPSLYLATAALNSQLVGKSVTVNQARSMVWNHDLTRVEQRPFFEREPTWKNVYYSTCRFSHDLLKETMRVKVPTDEIELELVVKELLLLLSRSEIRLGELIESTAAWLGLMGGQKRGFPAVSTAVANLANRLIDSGQASALRVGQTIFTMCWFFCGEYLSDRSVMREPTLFQDLERVTESITRHFQPDDVAELCQMRPDGGSAYPLIDSRTANCCTSLDGTAFN